MEHEPYGEPERDAGRPYLDRPLRSRAEAALDVALDCLRRIALPAGEEETLLERLTRIAAEEALDRIAILCPEKVKP